MTGRLGLALLTSGFIVLAAMQPALADQAGDAKIGKMLKAANVAAEYTDETFLVAMTREGIGRVTVAIVTDEDTATFVVIVAQKDRLRVTPHVVETLLGANYTYDYVKVFLHKNGSLNLAYSLRTRILDAAELKWIVGMMADKAEEIWAASDFIAK